MILRVADAFQDALQLLKPIVLIVLQQVVALEFTADLDTSDRVILVLHVKHGNLLMYVLHILTLRRLDHLHEEFIDTLHNLCPLQLENLDIVLDCRWNLTAFSLHSLRLFE